MLCDPMPTAVCYFFKIKKTLCLDIFSGGSHIDVRGTGFYVITQPKLVVHLGRDQQIYEVSESPF